MVWASACMLNVTHIDFLRYVFGILYELVQVLVNIAIFGIF